MIDLKSYSARYPQKDTHVPLKVDRAVVMIRMRSKRNISGPEESRTLVQITSSYCLYRFLKKGLTIIVHLHHLAIGKGSKKKLSKLLINQFMFQID